MKTVDADGIITFSHEHDEAAIDILGNKLVEFLDNELLNGESVFDIAEAVAIFLSAIIALGEDDVDAEVIARMFSRGISNGWTTFRQMQELKKAAN